MTEVDAFVGVALGIANVCTLSVPSTTGLEVTAGLGVGSGVGVGIAGCATCRQ